MADSTMISGTTEYAGGIKARANPILYLLSKGLFLSDVDASDGADVEHKKRLSLRLLARATALASAYFVFAFMGMELTREAGGIATFWPANAFLLVALLRAEKSVWPVYVAACALANLAANLTFTSEVPLALGLCASNMAEATLGALLVRHFCSAPFTLSSLRCATCLLVWGALVGPAFGALGGATALTLTYDSAFTANWTMWWLSDAMGIVIFAPALLAWSPAEFARLRSRVFTIEVAAVFLALGVVYLSDFVGQSVPIIYLVIPILLWAAVRLGTFWCALAGAIVTVTALFLETYGISAPLLFADHGVAGSALLWEVSLGIAILSPLAVAILLGERTRVASALTDSQNRLRDFAEAGSDWFFETDAQLRFTYVRGRAAELAAPIDEAVLGKTLREIAGVDQNTNLNAWRCLRDIGERRHFRSMEIFTPSFPGLPLYSRWSGTPFYAPDGTFKGYRGTGRDITDIREQEVRLAEIVNNIIEGLVLADQDGTIESVNPPLERMYGYSAVELIGKSITTLMPDADARDQTGFLDAYLKDGKKGHIGVGREVLSVRKDGTVFPADLSVSEIVMGRKRKFVAVIRDISEQKHAAAERERFLSHFHEAQKVEALGTLSRGIAHDFNNALFPIIGLTELTVTTLPDESTAHSTLSKVLTAAYHARDLVRQILAFSRIDPPNREPVELHKVIRDAVSFLRAALPSTIDIVESYDDAEGFVLADATQIYQVVVNLGSNAKDAMTESGGVLSIRLTKIRIREDVSMSGESSGYAERFKLSILDTGRGMDKETQARIFEPFFTTKSDARGTGLGLSVVHDIVAGHDGSIEVHSKPQEGSQFDIFLPTTTRAKSERQDSVGQRNATACPKPHLEST